MVQKHRGSTLKEERGTINYANTFRIGFTETEIFLDFGLVRPESKDEVELVTKVSIPIDVLKPLFLHLGRAGIDYEKEFDKDIGFSFLKKTDKD